MGEYVNPDGTISVNNQVIKSLSHSLTQKRDRHISIEISLALIPLLLRMFWRAFIILVVAIN